jgi:hypothetical protein
MGPQKGPAGSDTATENHVVLNGSKGPDQVRLLLSGYVHDITSDASHGMPIVAYAVNLLICTKIPTWYMQLLNSHSRKKWMTSGA